MTAATNPMMALRRRLQHAGINPKYLKERILPSWWSDDIARTPAGLAEVHGYLYSRIGIDLESLRDPLAPIRFNRPSVKHRRSRAAGLSELAVAESLATQAARVALRGVSAIFRHQPDTPGELRAAISSAGKHPVSFEALLDGSWRAGIPVIHLGNFPATARKMEGLAAMIKGRPAVVLSKNLNSPSWQSFILAHELGHIFRGHLAGNEVLADYQLDSVQSDTHEKEADLFALELLTGSPGLTFSSPYLLKAPLLAAEARRLGASLNIAPGVIVLNYARTKDGAWPLANAAMKHLESGKPAIECIHRKMIAMLDREQIGEESYDWLLAITGAGQYA